MAAKYLLSCECGAELTVEAHQAGDEIPCHCGAVLSVPALSKLRELPPAPEEESAESAGWSFRHGVLTIAVLVAAGLLAVGGYIWANEPEPLPAFSAVKRNQDFSKNLQRLSPAEAYLVWANQYASLASSGFSPMQNRQREFIQAEIDKRRMIEAILAVSAGVVMVGGVITYVAMSDSRSAVQKQ